MDGRQRSRVRIAKFYGNLAKIFNLQNQFKLGNVSCFVRNKLNFRFNFSLSFSLLHSTGSSTTYILHRNTFKTVEKILCSNWFAYEMLVKRFFDGRVTRVHRESSIHFEFRAIQSKKWKMCAHSAAHRSSPPFKINPNKFDTCAVRRIPLWPLVTRRSLIVMHYTILLLFAELNMCTHSNDDFISKPFRFSLFLHSIAARTRPIEKKQKTNAHSLDTIATENSLNSEYGFRFLFALRHPTPKWQTRI